MPDLHPGVKDHRVALKAALAINAVGEALEALASLARLYVEKGQMQAGANLLLFVMNHPDVRHDTFDCAEELFLDLESRACPRVLADAREFILGKSLTAMAAYALDISEAI